MQTNIAQRILLTVAYTEQFYFPLTLSELYSRLLVNFPVDTAHFLNTIVFLHKRRFLVYVDGHLFISGLSRHRMQELSSLRKLRKKISGHKWQELQEFINFAKKLPFITGVAVTGSLAMNNAVEDDDIDFMVVTAPHRLWLSRLLVILFANSKGKRRSFAREERNSWCFNLWVEESDLQLPVGSRSIYEAYEVIQAVWVVSKSNVATKFRSVNSWTHKVVNSKKYDFSQIETGQDWLFSFPIISEILFCINLGAFYFQYAYMKPHMTREKVSKTHAFFHPRDTKSSVFENWKQTLLRLV